jgi:hypothetical protein
MQAATDDSHELVQELKKNVVCPWHRNSARQQPKHSVRVWDSVLAHQQQLAQPLLDRIAKKKKKKKKKKQELNSLKDGVHYGCVKS